MFKRVAFAIVLGAAGATGACSKMPGPVAGDTAAAPAAAQPVGEPAWRPFSDDSPWNTKIAPDAAIDPQSRALIADLATRGSLHVNIHEWSIPVYEIDMMETPKVDIYDTYEGHFGRGFEHPRAIPMPEGAKPGAPVGGTAYMAIIDRSRDIEWDMRQVRQDEEGRWFIGFGAVSSLRGTGTSRPWNEADDPVNAQTVLPSGFPLLAGLIRPEEIKAGRIDHALAFSYPGVRPGVFVEPASTAIAVNDTLRSDGGGLPVGARIQLDPGFKVDASKLDPVGKIIARALQEYGAIVTDYAGGNVLVADSSPSALAAWDGVLTEDTMNGVFTPAVIESYFRVVEMGEVLPGQPAKD